LPENNTLRKINREKLGGSSWSPMVMAGGPFGRPDNRHCAILIEIAGTIPGSSPGTAMTP